MVKEYSLLDLAADRGWMAEVLAEQGDLASAKEMRDLAVVAESEGLIAESVQDFAEIDQEAEAEERGFARTLFKTFRFARRFVRRFGAA